VEKNVLFYNVSGLFFAFFLQILQQIKNFYQKSKCVHHPCTKRHLCAKFDVLRLLSPEISLGKNLVIPKQPAYFGIREREITFAPILVLAHCTTVHKSVDMTDDKTK